MAADRTGSPSIAQAEATKPYPALPYPLVLVEWLDSSRVGEGWVDLADIAEPNPSKCVSIGFLVRENEKGKVLSTDGRRCRARTRIAIRTAG